jgi:diaminopimelate epimerase
MIPEPEKTAVFVSDRHFGIGSDGLILICPSEVADFRMAMYNADGSQGQMCGNGVRCIAKYVYDYGLTDKTQISIETKGGIKYLDLTVEEGKVVSVKVDMGAPVLEAARIPILSDNAQVIDEEIIVNGTPYHMTGVSMGNPHAVVFVEDTACLDLEKMGPFFEHHPRFPERINTEFVEVLGPKEINMRVWERGSGETLACGTGACASAVACVLNHKTEDHLTVHLRGGDLELFYDRQNNTVWMTGPATVVFDGEINLPWTE